MRRHWLTRTLAGVFAVWFSLFGSEAVLGLHCPVHSSSGHADGHATTQSSPAADVHVQNDAAHSHSAIVAGDDTQRDQDHNCCLCIDESCTTAALPGSAPAAAPLVAAIDKDQAPPAATATPITRAAYSLPYANGPPSAV